MRLCANKFFERIYKPLNKINNMKWYSIIGFVIAIVSMFAGIIIAEEFGGSELLANIVLACQLGWFTPFVEIMKEDNR